MNDISSLFTHDFEAVELNESILCRIGTLGSVMLRVTHKCRKCGMKSRMDFPLFSTLDCETMIITQVLND